VRRQHSARRPCVPRTGGGHGDHVDYLEARCYQAQCIGAAGDPAHAAELLTNLVTTIERKPGPRNSSSFIIRRLRDFWLQCKTGDNLPLTHEAFHPFSINRKKEHPHEFAPGWRPEWSSPQWQRHFRLAQADHRAGGNPARLNQGQPADSRDPGAWINQQLHEWEELTAAEQWLLREILEIQLSAVTE
jgi:hypothetical protein